MPISMRRIEEVLTPLTSELSARAANATVGNADIRSGEFATDRFESAVNRPAAHVAPNVNMPMLDDLDVEEAAVVYLKDRLTRLAADKAAFHTLLGDIFQAPKARIEALTATVKALTQERDALQERLMKYETPSGKRRRGKPQLV